MWIKMVCIADISDVAQNPAHKGMPILNPPKKGEIVHCRQCRVYYHSFDVLEYLYSKTGIPQSFNKKDFAPIEEKGETMIEEIIEELVSVE